MIFISIPVSTNHSCCSETEAGGMSPKRKRMVLFKFLHAFKCNHFQEWVIFALHQRRRAVESPANAQQGEEALLERRSSSSSSESRRVQKRAIDWNAFSFIQEEFHFVSQGTSNSRPAIDGVACFSWRRNLH